MDFDPTVGKKLCLQENNGLLVGRFNIFVRSCMPVWQGAKEYCLLDAKKLYMSHPE